MVRIEWNDILAELNTTESPGLAKAVTLGFLEKCTDEYICLSDDYPGGYSDKICIPRGCITRIVYLKEDRNKIDYKKNKYTSDNQPF